MDKNVAADTVDTGKPVRARILLVDDDERNLLALSEVMSDVADVVTATSGQDALRQLLKGDFAVILLDVFMPGLDGYETASLIREREQTARIPIIFLSAVNKETEHLMRGYSMGAVDYVFKPVDPLVLKSKVSVFVDLYNMRSQIEEKSRAEHELRDANFRAELGRLQIEKELQETLQRQAVILDAMPLALYEGVEQGDGPMKRRFVGGDLERLVGSGRGDAGKVADDWDRHIHADDLGRLKDAVADGDGAVTIEYRWLGDGEDVRHFLDQRVLIGRSDGETRWAGTLFDVTRQKRLESQLVQAGKMDAIGQLTGGIAHDFNNLLAAVLGGLHVIERRLEMGEREQRIVGQMRHAAEQGAELVRRMMAFARKQDLTPASIDPAVLCQSVAGLVEHALGGRVEIEWHCPDTHLNLFVDRSQLELTLVNLILNARDAMPDGGKIDVSIHEYGDDENGDEETRLCIRVRDQGNGIPPEMIDKITEPFFTTKEAGKGTGLGLSMAAGFVQQSGGELRIESEVGKGSTIEVILPATAADEGLPATVQPAAPRPSLKGKKMLVIDDDESVRLVLCEQLRDLDIIVDDYSSGSSAVAAVRGGDDKYDFVLSDFAMPGMNGLETIRELNGLLPHARAVLMTGYADESVTRGAKTSIPIVHKPLDIEKVCEALRT